ncbi:hypothetical protein FOL46_003313, partial [Perkinsus olseni]
AEVLAMVEDVNYAEAEAMVKMVEEARNNGMDLAVRCMAAGIKANVDLTNVDGKLTKTFMFKGPVVLYEYSREVKQGGGLSFAVTPLIRLETFDEFERRIMSLTLIKGSSFVPGVWSALSPELRLFIVSGETVFPDAKAGDELSVEVLEEAGIWYPGSVLT